MSENGRPLQIGQINYTNAWPLFYDFPGAALEGRVEMIRRVPSELNRGLAEGNIDLSAVSSFAYAEHADKLLLLPDLSVSSDGKVGSILLFHRVPVRQLDGRSIAVTTTSATSVNLLKILMHKYYEVSPVYEPSTPNLDAMMECCEAALLIGDDAIRAEWANKGRYLVTDLGEQWKQFSGYGMTYAVWALRRDAADRYPRLIADIVQEFQRCKQMGLTLPQDMIHRAMLQIGGSERFWKQYFSGLRYDFGAAEKAGLTLYFRLAYELGLLPRLVEPVLWQESQDSW
ncbi:menaquinone biosynthesis protein [Paenibacillus turpanensis]|uniref:menaquinone biosynthesis protein n=1 Tax=Paenibacillus turpanensis TaxID=2689078 RepID=UPI003132BE43